MTYRKDLPRRQPGTGKRPTAGTMQGKDLNTAAARPMRSRLSAAARRELGKLRPWNKWRTAVVPAPEYFPGAVKTLCCPFCGGTHVYDGPTGPDDPGIRTLQCPPGTLLWEWQLPPSPETAVLYLEARDDDR